MRITRAARRCKDERGAAIVEFALLIPIILLFLFGIITFGLILSFKQGITQAAAEGARAAAVVAYTQAKTAAVDATRSGVSGFGKTCNQDALTCDVQIVKCADTTQVVAAPTGFGECVRVEVSYDYKAKPLIAPLPFISAALPETLASTSIARVSDGSVTTTTTTVP